MEKSVTVSVSLGLGECQLTANSICEVSKVCVELHFEVRSLAD